MISFKDSFDCQHDRTKKHGHDRYGNQRILCKDCGATWIIKPPRPLGDMRISMDDAVFALKLLMEGMSIRSCERLTGLNRNTLCDLVATVGAKCEKFLRDTVINVPAKEVECDELWGFIKMKEKTRQRLGYGEAFGDCYTFVAMERTTKLILTWLVGRRTPDNCWEFIRNLHTATYGRMALSTDGYSPYGSAVPLTFSFNVDYAKIIKRFHGDSDVEVGRRYSPANIVSTTKARGCGNPDLDTATTSHIERLNLSFRMTCRRLTRLTNAHSKSQENHAAMLALFVAWYNFCRVHSTIGMTPAKAQGLADHTWEIEELLTAAA